MKPISEADRQSVLFAIVTLTEDMRVDHRSYCAPHTKLKGCREHDDHRSCIRALCRVARVRPPAIVGGGP